MANGKKVEMKLKELGEGDKMIHVLQFTVNIFIIYIWSNLNDINYTKIISGI